MYYIYIYNENTPGEALHAVAARGIAQFMKH